MIWFQIRSTEALITEPSISRKKLTWIFIMLGLTLLLAGSVFGVDWANYFLKTSVPYPVIAKPVITVIAMILVLAIGKNRLSKGINLFIPFNWKGVWLPINTRADTALAGCCTRACPTISLSTFADPPYVRI